MAAVAAFFRTNQDSLLAFAALSSERLLQMFVGLYVAGSIARGFSHEHFAAWQVAFSMFVVVGTVCDVAHERVVLPMLCGAPPTRHATLWNSILVAKLIAGAASVMLMLGWAAFAGQPEVLALAVLWSAYLFLGEPVALAVYESYARENFAWPQACRIAAMLLRLVVVIAVVALQGGLLWMAAAWLAEILLLNLLVCRGWIRSRRFRPALVDWTLVRWIFAQGCTLSLAAAAAVALVRIERLLLGNIVPAPVLSHYVASMNLLEAALAFSATLLTVVGAKTLFRSGRVGIGQHAQLVLFAAAIASLGAALIFAIAPWAVVIVFGSDYASSATYLRIGTWLLPLAFAQAILQAPLLLRASRRFHLVKAMAALSLCAAAASLAAASGHHRLLSAGAYAGFLTLIAFDLFELRRRAGEIYLGRS
jgi:O-antigen/teichoic acid export membrane protein